jgi:hypothetical protein
MRHGKRQAISVRRSEGRSFLGRSAESAMGAEIEGRARCGGLVGEEVINEDGEEDVCSRVSFCSL